MFVRHLYNTHHNANKYLKLKCLFIPNNKVTAFYFLLFYSILDPTDISVNEKQNTFLLNSTISMSMW